MADFELAPDVEIVAQKVIAEHHKSLAELKIAYLFREGNWSSQNRETWAKIFKVSDRDKLLNNYDYILVVNVEVWWRIDAPIREALIDHELSHIGMDDNGAWKMFGHDLEDFVAVVRRRGPWTEEARLYLKAAEAHEKGDEFKQITLFDNQEEAAAGKDEEGELSGVGHVVSDQPAGKTERELHLVQGGSQAGTFTNAVRGSV